MDLPPLTPPLIITLVICGAALLLFVWNRLPFELVGLVVMAALVVFDVLPLSEALSGFSNEALITVAGLLILSAGLQQTGVVDMIAEVFTRIVAGNELKLIIALFMLTIPASAFLNNTAVVAVLIPVVLEAARRYEIAPSRLLIPLSFSSQLGGTLTLMGSSTNLLVSGVLVELGLPRLGFFQMTGAASVLMLAGMAYLLTIGRRLLPVRQLPEVELQLPFSALESALIVEEDSSCVGSTFREMQAKGLEELHLKSLRRASKQGIFGDEEPLRPGDLLVVEGPSDALTRADRVAGLHFALPRKNREIGRDELVVMEAVITPRSRISGRKVREVGSADLYGASILAVQRHGRRPDLSTAERELRPGDLVLLEGTQREIKKCQQSRLFLLVTPVPLPLAHDRWWLASGILLAVVLLAAMGVFSMPVSVLLGVIAMIATGCIEPGDAYERMDWGVIILIGSIVPLGLAMQQTGAAQLIATLMLRATGEFGPYVVLGAMYLTTSLLTEFISNNAAAVILTPVAVAIAGALGVSPLPFAMAVMIAASNSFTTPVGYQTNTLIYGPGAYTFGDFFRVGALLSLLLVILAVVVLPLFFPF